jgi:surface protein
MYPTAFRIPLNGGGWQNASRRSKSYQRTFANSKVNSGISGWGPSRFAKSTREMFKDNTVFSKNINKLFATGNPNSLIDMEGMFENTQAFSKHMLNWNTSKVTNMINVFKNSKYDRRLDTWDVAKVTSMKGFLEGNTDYASGDGGDFRDIKEWFDPYLNPDGSKRDASDPRTFAIESLENIFKDSAVNVDVSTWNTSTVTNMKNVFNGNTAFDQDISDWDTTNVSTENLAGFATGATGLTASEVPSSVPSDSVAADSSSDDSSSDDSSSGETTSMFNFFGTTSTSYSNVYGSSVTNGETSIFDSTYSSDVSNGVTFSPVTDTSDIPNFNSHVEDVSPDFTISSSFKLAYTSNGNGYATARVSLQKLWDDQVDGEGWNPATDGDVDIADLQFSDDGISRPMFYLDEDIGLFFKRVTERELTLNSVSTEARFFSTASDVYISTTEHLSDNDDLSDGDYLVLHSQGSYNLYRRNSNSTGDGTFGYYSGWTDESFVGTNYEIDGDVPEKIKYSLSNMTDTVAVNDTTNTDRVASVNLNGDTLEFKVDFGGNHTINSVIASIAADYNDQTETLWDFGVVKIENS